MEEDKFISIVKEMYNFFYLIGKNDIDFMISTSIAPIPLGEDHLEIRNSEIDGKGVFAKVDFPKNLVITLYPCHCIRLSDNSHYFSQGQFEIDDRYLFKFSSNCSIIGNPSFTSNSNLLGHMINSHSKLEIRTNEEQEIRHAVCKYLIKSKGANNCEFCIWNKNICYIKTTKDIAKDEELVLSYSPIYWMCEEQKNILRKVVSTDDIFYQGIRMLL